MDKGRNFTVIDDLIGGKELSDAIQSSGSKEAEQLQAYTKLSQMYFESLWNEKKIGGFFLKFQEEVMSTFSESTKDLYRQMLFDTVTFHAVGRICNDNSVEERTNFAEDSSEIYGNYFYSFVYELTGIERKILLHILYYNTYVIANQNKKYESYEEYMKYFLSKINNQDKYTIRRFENISDSFRVDAHNFEWKNVVKDCESENSFYSEVDAHVAECTKEYDKNICSMLRACSYFANQQYSEGKVFVGNNLDINYGM